MPNIPGSVILPGAYSESEVVTTGLNLPGSNRVVCIIGEGLRREVLVNYAQGSGLDGLDPTYTTTLGADGRHFQLSQYPIVSSRLVLTKNGIPLVGLEGSTLTAGYDYIVDITVGQIELKTAQLVPQGSLDYAVVGTPVGNGTIENLSLIDVNAPTETWTIRCASVRKDTYGNPMDGYGKFTVSGSVSGNILDGYGAPIVWQSDSVIRNNGILNFSIDEGVTPFNTGDTFRIVVESGVLKTADSLIAEYIATLDVNDPVLQTNMEDIKSRYGMPSTDNTLSLGCQLALANGAPAILCLQTYPSIPRRTSDVVLDAGVGGTTLADLEFALPIGKVPNIDSSINFFLKNNTTNAETQIIPNKVAFYDPTITSDPNEFCQNGQPYSYTVVMQNGVTKQGDDLTITPAAGFSAYLTSDTITFDDSDTGLNIVLFGATNSENNGTFTVVAQPDGSLLIRGSYPYITETAVNFRLVDNTQQSAFILLTKDLKVPAGYGLRVTYIDEKDATFYDAGWISALEKLEAFELDVLVPLPKQTISAIFGNCKQHCLKMSQIKNRKERVLLIGAITGLTWQNVTGVNPAAVEDIGVLEGIQGDTATEILAGETEDLTNYSVPDAFGNTYRVSYMYPDRIVVSISGSNTYVDGFYLAAAYGGWLAASGNINVPSTNKTLSGFSILRDRTFNQTVLENLVKAGVVVVEPVLGGGRILWGLTTSQSGFIEEQELSIVAIRDYISKTSRTAMQGFVGSAESPTFLTSLNTRLFAVVNSYVNQNLITKYADVKVVRDSVDSRQYNCTFRVMPNYPCNWIYIKYQVGTF